MSTVDIEALTKVYDDGSDHIVAVDEVDVSIRDGEFLVLVGPSGCGKSTTLRCIAGLESVTRGDIRLDEESVVGRKPMDRNMAMVFQNYALYPHMTARQNMAFGLKMTTDRSADEIETQVEDTAEMMSIEELLDKKPRELSGGQQQRVALGRAIVRDPEVFLLDEPLSNLDAKLRTQMRTELQNLQSKLDVTTIYVTHDQTEAMTMGDRIAILDGGELQQIGTPLECYHQPANQFVAGFIGSPSMNFFDVEVRDGTLEHDGFTYPLSSGVGSDRDDGTSDLVLGIRPEDVELASGDESIQIAARVDVVEPTGEATYLYLETGGDTYTASVSGDTILPEDTAVDVAFPEEKIHLFDGETGTSIRSREAPADRSEFQSHTSGDAR